MTVIETLRRPGPGGILLDFYGTVVADDEEAVSSIVAAVSAASGGRATAEQVGQTWWCHFESACRASRGSRFRHQRDLAALSLGRTLREFAVDLDATELTRLMVHGWRSPPAYPDARLFLDQCPVPICVLSDIDRDEIEAAIAHAGLPIAHVVTSDDVRAYKPAPQGFRAAAAVLGLPITDLWHVGDSRASDVAGAAALGIKAIWINRRAEQRRTPTHVPDAEVRTLTELLPILG